MLPNAHDTWAFRKVYESGLGQRQPRERAGRSGPKMLLSCRQDMVYDILLALSDIGPPSNDDRQTNNVYEVGGLLQVPGLCQLPPIGQL